MKKLTRFTATDSAGQKFTWQFGKDVYWFVVDHTGYKRNLEKTWIDSAPQLNQILENHGLYAKIS